MQGLRPLQAYQDENSGILSRGNVPGKSFAADDGRNVAMKTPVAAGIPPSARKALGNITNSRFEPANILPAGKTQAGGTVVRKALGSLIGGPTKQQNPSAASQEDRIDRLEIDGVEQTYGKGWRELEREREAREDFEISQRLSFLASSLSRPRPFPPYLPDWSKTKENAPLTLESPVKGSKSLSHVVEQPDIFDFVDSQCDDPAVTTLPHIPGHNDDDE